jgi:hypothetical protein
VDPISFEAPKSLGEIRALRADAPRMREQISEQRGLLAAESALCTLRERAGVSQADLAARLRSAPLGVSVTDPGSDLRLVTVARYVGALGGTLRLVATLGDEEIDVDLSTSRSGS